VVSVPAGSSDGNKTLQMRLDPDTAAALAALYRRGAGPNHGGCARLWPLQKTRLWVLALALSHCRCARPRAAKALLGRPGASGSSPVHALPLAWLLTLLAASNKPPRTPQKLDSADTLGYKVRTAPSPAATQPDEHAVGYGAAPLLGEHPRFAAAREVGGPAARLLQT
jgi:hypothetical protein